jgi:hypothetical protein
VVIWCIFFPLFFPVVNAAGSLFLSFFWSATPSAAPPPQPLFQMILFTSTTLLTDMTGISFKFFWKHLFFLNAHNDNTY